MTSSPLTTTPVSAVLTRPADAVAVVGAPCPDVVEDHVVAVHLEADRRLPDGGAADAEEDVLQRGRVVGITLVGVSGTDLEQHGRAHGPGVEDQP